MRILQTIAMVALACIAAAQDTEKFNLTRQFKEGSVHKYRISVKIEEGQSVEIKGLIEGKAGKVDKDGKAEVDFKVSEFSMSADGGAGGGEAPGATKFSIDRQNMPQSLDVQNEGAVFVALSVASYLPAKELTKGEAFKIDWKGKDNGGILTGRGSITEIKTDNGVKIAVVKSNVEITPAGQSQPADLEIVSEFNLADGTLIKSSAKGSLPGGGALAFTLTLVK